MICLLSWHTFEYVYEYGSSLHKSEWRPTGGGRWERMYYLKECVDCGKQVWQPTAELRDILGDVE